MARLLVLLLMVGCARPEDGTRTFLENHDPDAKLVLGIERLGEGPFVAGETERFRLVGSRPGSLAVEWKTSGGELFPAGEEVEWVLPSSGRARLNATVFGADGLIEKATWAFGTQQPTAYDPSMQGVVDPDDVSTGMVCSLAFDSAGMPHIAYSDDTHGSLRYASWDGAAWTHEVVDGPGFNQGGFVPFHVSLALDADDHPHMAYKYGTNEVRYAHFDGASWTRHTVGDPVDYVYWGQSAVGIALDPTQGTGSATQDRPTVVFQQQDQSITVLYRTDVSSWVAETGPTSSEFAGGLSFAADGTLYFSRGTNERWVSTWTSGGGFGDEWNYENETYPDAAWQPLVLDPLGQPLVLSRRGLWHQADGVDWSYSSVEPFVLDSFGVAYGPKPAVVVWHAPNWELIMPDANGYWDYTVFHTGGRWGDVPQPGVAFDPDGDPHVCFRMQPDDHLLYY